MGYGSSPRSLSPTTGIWRPASPVEGCWLSVSRRYDGLHERMQSLSGPQRTRPAVSPPPTYWVRLLSSTSTTPAGACPSNPVKDASENECILRHFREVGIKDVAANSRVSVIVGLTPRVLSLTPQVAFPFSAGRLFLSGRASQGSDVIADPESSPASRRLLGRSLNPRCSIPLLLLPVATPD